jgi:hypothetical protein
VRAARTRVGSAPTICPDAPLPTPCGLCATVPARAPTTTCTWEPGLHPCHVYARELVLRLEKAMRSANSQPGAVPGGACSAERELAAPCCAPHPTPLAERRRAHQEAQSFKYENLLLRQQLDDLKTRMDNFSSSSPDKEAGKAAAALPAAKDASAAVVD